MPQWLMHVQDAVFLEIALRLLAALGIGALIGLERSYHGRPAGFRTHALVCLASAVLMLVTVYESQWFSSHGGARVAVDPTRMSQGIMTGIGFLGAGAIIKEGLTIRGLTTAASIWITAAIGILVGIGFYMPAGLAAVLTLGTLSVFRWIESRMPALLYYEFTLRIDDARAPSETELLSWMGAHRLSMSKLSRRFKRGEGVAEFRMTIRATDEIAIHRLCADLRARDEIAEFRVAPIGD
ncbi:MAG: MgtC/SapB family protein [Betaproteobacteria bacterium]|nr:MAG: MgtC/SapB family protein [Betaproteobacteria bacterium]